MEKKEIIQKLKELGIDSENCYPKKTFVLDKEVLVACYKRELLDNFYFFLEYDKTMYKISKIADIEELPTNNFMGSTKYLVPFDFCVPIWTAPADEVRQQDSEQYLEDGMKKYEHEIYQELEDDAMKLMTIRDLYAIIQNKPVSNKTWLNNIIDPPYFRGTTTKDDYVPTEGISEEPSKPWDSAPKQ